METSKTEAIALGVAPKMGGGVASKDGSSKFLLVQFQDSSQLAAALVFPGECPQLHYQERRVGSFYCSG